MSRTGYPVRHRPRPAMFSGKLQILAVLTILLGFVVGCGPKGQGAGPSESTERKPDSESRVQRGTNGEVVVKIDTATQKAIGLQTAPIEKAQLPREAKAYGRVLDPGPLAASVADLATAQAAATASGAELKRVEGLAAQNNASQKALEGARAAAVRDEVQVQSVRLRLLANWGEEIAEREDLAVFVQKLSSLQAALIQFNLPAGEVLPAAPVGARVMTLADSAHPIKAQPAGAAPVTDPQMQNRGFFFVADASAGLLGPGEAVTGLLELPGEPLAGVAVPRSAVLHFNGAVWVYVQTGEEGFRRVEIHPGPPLGSALFVQEGLRAGDKLVTVGAQQLLSEELKGQSGE